MIMKRIQWWIFENRLQRKPTFWLVSIIRPKTQEFAVEFCLVGISKNLPNTLDLEVSQQSASHLFPNWSYYFARIVVVFSNVIATSYSEEITVPTDIGSKSEITSRNFSETFEYKRPSTIRHLPREFSSCFANPIYERVRYFHHFFLTAKAINWNNANFWINTFLSNKTR